jgi:uncharacterized protein YpmB
MKRVISYTLMLMLLIFWAILGSIVWILKQIQKPFTRGIEYLDKLINKVNIQA